MMFGSKRAHIYEYVRAHTSMCGKASTIWKPNMSDMFIWTEKIVKIMSSCNNSLWK